VRSARRRRRAALGAALTLVALAAAVSIWRLGDTWPVEPARAADAALLAAAHDAATTNASIVAEWFGGAEAEAAGSARSLEPWTGGSAQVATARGRLEAARAGAGSFDDGLVVVDSRGLVISSTADRAALVGQRRLEEQLPAVLGGRATVSGLADDPLDRVRRVAVAVPLHAAGGRVTGAVAGLTRLPGGSLAAAIARVDGGVVVVSSDGRVLDGHDYPVAEREDETVVAPAGHGYTVVRRVPADLGVLTRSEVRRRTRLVLGLALGLGLSTAATLEVLRRRSARRAEHERISFLAVAGHELRTPLALVKGMSGAMARSSTRPDRARISEALERQARALEHRIERLLLAADLRAGTHPRLTTRPVDLLPIIERTAADLGADSPAHDIEVRADGPMWVQGDARAIEQVIDNVVENAVRFSPGGGSVHITARRERSRVLVDVDDEGVGLPSDLEAMFEPFGQRGDTVTRGAEEGGMGLGLFISSSLMGQIGGSIDAHRLPTGARMTLGFAAAVVPTD
jgi:signal transduction histidine kinase